MTPYSEVYKFFLAEVQDDLYVLPEELDGDEEEVVLEDLNTLLKKSITEFSYPKVDIRNYDDMLQQFNVDLDIDEIEILAMGMVIAWSRRELQNVDVMEQIMTTKDFNTYSQAPQLRALQTLLRNAEKRLRRKLIKYSIRTKDYKNNLGELGK